jgi:hypothetical protein
MVNGMFNKLILILCMFIFAVPAFADKPEWAGEAKPSKEQVEHHKDEMTSKHSDKKLEGKNKKDKKEKKDKEDNDEDND